MTGAGPGVRLVDEEAMIAHLRSGHIAFAGLDVAMVEPLPDSSPLWDLPNVLISPHTTDAQDKAVDAASVKLGVPTGPKMGIEFRQHVAEHSDTITAGPVTVAEWLKRIGE